MRFFIEKLPLGYSPVIVGILATMRCEAIIQSPRLLNSRSLLNALLYAVRLFVIIENAAVGQRHIGDEMKAVKRFPDGQVGYRRIDMRMQLQARTPRPRAFHVYVDETVGDQLSYRDGAVDVRD